MLDLYTDDSDLITIFVCEADALEHSASLYRDAQEFDKGGRMPPRSSFAPMERKIRAAGLTVTVWAVVDPTTRRPDGDTPLDARFEGLAGKIHPYTREVLEALQDALDFPDDGTGAAAALADIQAARHDGDDCGWRSSLQAWWAGNY